MSENDTEPTQSTSEDISVQLDWVPKQSKWPLVVALLLVLGLGYGAWKLFFDVKLSPTKILIAVQTETIDGTRGSWWGAKGKVSARYADAMAHQLEELGLEPLSGADPEFLKEMEDTESLDDILALARSKGIRWVLTGTIKATKEMPIKGVDEERIDTLISTELQLHDTSEGAGEPITIELMAPQFFLTWQSDFESALEKRNTELLVERHIADVAKTLSETEHLSPYSTTDQETSEATILASKLEPLFGLSRRYALALDARKETLEKDEEHATKNRARPTSRLLTPSDISEDYVGRTHDGGLVSLKEGREVFFSPKKGQILAQKTYDELVVSAANGSNRKSLFQTYNIFSHPQVSRDGRWVGLVVDHHDRGTSIVRVSTSDGKTEELLYTEKEYVSDVSPSPDGANLVYWAGACANCNKGVRVVSSGKTDYLQILTPDEASTTRFLPEWSANGKKLFFSGEREGFLRSVWSVSVPGLKFTPLAGNALPPPEDEKKEAVVGEGTADRAEAREEGDIVDRDPPEFWIEDVSSDGKALLLKEQRDHGDRKTLHWVELELESGKFTELMSRHRLDRRARFSPNGKSVAFRTKKNENKTDSCRYDWEIGIVDRTTRKITTLTANASDEFFLDFAHGSNRIYYSTQHRSHHGPCGKHCTRIHWMEL